MDKKNKLTIILTSLICLVPFVISAIYYKELPDMVATHFNNSGQPDGYSSKLVAAFGIPASLLVVNLITNFTIEKNPMNGKGGKILSAIGIWTLPFTSIIVETAIIAYARGIRINFSSYVFVFVGLLTIVVGNYLPKCEYNSVVGIKTPWALKDKDNWKKTHRISGFIWVIGGFILCINAFAGIEALNITVILAMVIIPFVWSYLLSRKNVRV
ncbi:MAG: SdpI family protein [Clostridium sp.]|nr:SdpI family protein [Clostridium sp.]